MMLAFVSLVTRGELGESRPLTRILPLARITAAFGAQAVLKIPFRSVGEKSVECGAVGGNKVLRMDHVLDHRRKLVGRSHRVPVRRLAALANGDPRERCPLSTAVPTKCPPAWVKTTHDIYAC